MTISLPQLKKLLAKKVFAAIDTTAAGRAALKNVATELGFAPEKIQILDQYRVALKGFKLKRPDVVVIEYAGTGVDARELVRQYRKEVDGAAGSAVYYVADGALLHAKTAAAAEDLEGVFFKPLAFALMARSISDAVRRNESPALFDKTLRSARTVHWVGNAEVSYREFLTARTLATTEAHAHAYLGEAELAKGDVVAASRFFTEGLKINSSDYRCLTGLSRVLLRLGKTADAQSFHEKSLRNFPVLPERIPELVRMSLANRRFSDIADLHKLFKAHGDGDAKTAHALTSALLLAGKGLVVRDQARDALRVFELAWECAGNDPAVLARLAATMIRCGMLRDCRRMMQHSPPSVKEAPDVLLAEFEDIYRGGDARACVTFGMDLLKRGIKSTELYLGMIERSVAMGRRKGIVEDLINAAIKDFPDSRAKFEDYRVLTEGE